MPNETVMVVGSTGRVGCRVLEYLARTQCIKHIVAADKNADILRRIVENTIVCTSICKLYPRIDFVQLDLDDEEESVTALCEHRPKVVVNAATLMSSYYYIAKIKKRAKHKGLRSYLAGHTLAKDLYLILKLMKATKKSRIDTHVVNVAFPDITHCVLGKIGLAPTVGAGTIDLTVNGIQRIVAERMRSPIHNIAATMVAHHALRINPPEIVPFYLKICLGDKDITAKFDSCELIREASRSTTSTFEVTNESLAASSASENARNILFDSENLTHAPGANGALGGAPVRLSAKGAEIVPPDGMSITDVEKINEGGLKFDGIERIKDDGTVVFTDETYKLMREVLNIEWKSMRIDETKDMADDLKTAYERLS